MIKNRLLPIALISAMLGACTGGEEEQSSSSIEQLSSSSVSSQASSDTVSSTTSSSTAISSSSVSSSVVVVSSSSEITVSSSSSEEVVASSSAPSGLTGDIARGEMLLLKAGNGVSCFGCHGNSDSSGYVSGPAPGAIIDPDALGSPANGPTYSPALNDLANYISVAMDRGGCDEQCAVDVAAYIISKQDGIPGPAASITSCELQNDDIRYGKRFLKVLAKHEHANSLQSLFKIPLAKDYSPDLGADDAVKGFPSNANRKIQSDDYERFEGVASEVATWAIANPASLSFTCDEVGSCHQSFINEFATKAFRRPLTSTEVASYKTVFEEASSPEVGLEWAIRSVLASPQFLYRSELGRTVAEVLEGEPPTTGTVGFGDDAKIYDGSLFSGNSSFGLYERAANDGGIIDYQFTGNDLVEVVVKATQNANGDWPTMEFAGSQTAYGEVELNHSEERSYQFSVEGLQGGQYFYFLNKPVNGNNPGHTIEIVSLKMGKAVVPVIANVNQSLLERAESDAYVLDAYEYASALSYFLTGGSPDDELLAAAASGAIFEASELETHVSRLMDSDLGREQVGRFAGFWFRTDSVRNASLTPRVGGELTQEVRDSMAQEVREIFKESFYSEGDFLDIYRGDYTMLDKTLSDYYGIAGGGSQHMEFQKVSTASLNRGGVFASGAFMVVNASAEATSPVRRSVHFRQEMLCQDIPAPNSLGTSPEERQLKVVDANAHRDGAMGNEATYYSILTSPQACDACHKSIINPLFAADDFDRFGRLRERSGGEVFQTAMTYLVARLDANGDELVDGEGNVLTESKLGTATVNATGVNAGGVLLGGYSVGSIGSAANQDEQSGSGIAFTGAKALSKVAADKNLPGLEACLVDRSARLAFGEPLDERLVGQGLVRTEEQQSIFNCVKDDISKAYSDSGNSARAVFKALAMSDLLLFRK